MATTQTLAPRTYALRESVTMQTLHDWLKAGLPLLPDGRIDPDAADKWRADNLDQAKRNHQEPTPGSLNDARRAREQLKVEREQLKLGIDRGELIDRYKVRRYIEARGRLDRESHMAWVSRLSALLASEFSVDPAKLYARLDAEMRNHLRDLSETPLIESEGVE